MSQEARRRQRSYGRQGDPLGRTLRRRINEIETIARVETPRRELSTQTIEREPAHRGIRRIVRKLGARRPGEVLIMTLRPPWIPAVEGQVELFLLRAQSV